MWTALQLRRLRRFIANGASLKEAAQCVGHSASDCDMATWKLFGRSIEDALTILNGSATEGTGAVVAPVRAGAL